MGPLINGVENRVTHAFDRIAEAYDGWYETPEGQAIFDAEASCLRSLCPQFAGRWLEVGVGTGRFASVLGIGEGVDPSPRMLEIAARRGIRIREGCAESLPFLDGWFDGVLAALTLCFVADPAQALRECRRVLCSDGKLLLGIIPADSAWGIEYAEKASKGHPVYALARFRRATEVVTLAEHAGFGLLSGASTLFWNPGDAPKSEPRVTAGIVAGAGFVGLLFKKAGAEAAGGGGSEGRI